MSRLRIICGDVFSGSGQFRKSDVCVLNDRIVTEKEYLESEDPEEVLNAEGAYVIPGLTDIHMHGCAGSDCCDGTGEAFRKMAVYELSQGITSFTPATMTLPEEDLIRIASAASLYENREGADFCGLYLEGPFISPEKKGAQKEDYIREPDIGLFRRLQEASGHKIRTAVIAPERKGALDWIREASAEVTVSIGHTCADYDTACRAFEAGASQVTHLFNAMPPFLHREPGPAGAAADHPEVRVEMICDGIHVHPAAVRAAFAVYGDDRIIFISDSMRAAGLPDGESELGGQKVMKKGRKASLPDGTIAGSVTNLMDCLRTAVKEMGIPLVSAVKCGAVNPAKAAGIYGDYGTLNPGAIANIVILNRNLDLMTVIRHGKISGGIGI